MQHKIWHEKTFLQIRLPPVTPLSAIGRSPIHTNARLKLCKPYFCLPSPWSRLRQIIVKLHEKKNRQNNQSRPMCTKCGRYWHCSGSQKTVMCQYQDSFWMYPKCRKKLTMSKCHFGVKQVDFLGHTVTPNGVAPQAEKGKNFVPNYNSTNPKKHSNGV